MSNDTEICKRFCEKTGECLLDRIESSVLLTDGFDIVEDLKVAMPNRAKAFKLVLNDARERMSEEFWDNMDFKEEEFVWSDSVDCNNATIAGRFAISTEIRLDDLSTTVSDAII